MTLLRRDLLLGAIAGLVGGLVFAWAMQAQGMMAAVAGLFGFSLLGYGLVVHVLVSAAAGAGFGALFRYQAGAYAATASAGLLYGLLWWIAGPLTFAPLLAGQSPTWSIMAANLAFASLFGHLLYGGLTASAFYLLCAYVLRRGWFPVVAPPAPQRRRVVILGGGFGGTSAAQRLEHLFRRERGFESTLVSTSNYLLFTPMLAEVASSGLEAQHISAPVRASCPQTRFWRGEVEAIDTQAQVVHVSAATGGVRESLPYDHLVLALGAVPAFHGLPGVAEHAFTLKTLEDAIGLRNHVIGLLERADSEPAAEIRQRHLTFVVAGGGFAGTEMIAELFDLAHSIRRYYPNIPAQELRFVLIHSREQILPELSAELGAYALRKLQARGIEFLLGARVAGATADGVQLSGGQEIPTHTLVWTAGNQPSPLLATLPCERNRGGAVIATEMLQVKGMSNVWAVGDCAQIPDVLTSGQFCPPTAQHALREGKVVADNIAAALRGQSLKPFRFRTIGMLVALGHRTGVAEIRGYKFSGLLAWLMWRTVYLSKLPGLEKKVRVALDWLIDLFFPRDIVLTGPSPGRLSGATAPAGERKTPVSGTMTTVREVSR